MSKYRLEKINKLIQKELSDIIFENIESSRDNFITITSVITKPDLSSATVYVSALKDEEEILENLNKRSPFLRALLGKRVRLRKIPALKFEKDFTRQFYEKYGY